MIVPSKMAECLKRFGKTVRENSGRDKQAEETARAGGNLAIDEEVAVWDAV